MSTKPFVVYSDEDETKSAVSESTASSTIGHLGREPRTSSSSLVPGENTHDERKVLKSSSNSSENIPQKESTSLKAKTRRDTTTLKSKPALSKVETTSKTTSAPSQEPSSPSKRKLVDLNASNNRNTLAFSVSTTPLMTPQKPRQKRSTLPKKTITLSDGTKIDPENKENWDPIQKVYSTDREAKKSKAKKMEMMHQSLLTRAPLKDITGLFSLHVGPRQSSSSLAASENVGAITVFSERVSSTGNRNTNTSANKSETKKSEKSKPKANGTRTNNPSSSRPSDSKKHSAGPENRSRILMMR